MRSVRFEEDLEKRLGQASQATGLSASEIIRAGVRRECDEILSTNLAVRLADYIGAMSSKSADASRRKNERKFASKAEPRRDRRSKGR